MALDLRHAETTAPATAADCEALRRAIDAGVPLPGVIWAGRSLSDPIPLHGALAVKLVPVGDLDRSPLTFQASGDGVSFADCLDDDGRPVEVEADRIIPPDFSGPAFVRLRAGTAARPTLSALPRAFYAVLIFGRPAEAARARARIAAQLPH